jgi:ketose-bisphosphate aldolase
MAYRSTKFLMAKACQEGIAIPGFNIPYLPMLEPVVRALRDCDAVGLVMVARLEWEKFESGSLEAVRDEYGKHRSERHTRLHLDHVPVIDEDDRRVDYAGIIRRAVAAGYESVMVDGSRLPFAENVACTKEIVDLAHAAGIPVEAELGAVMGHEAGPLPPYEELFASGKGFTDPEEAAAFVRATGVDWLSVAIGNIHGAISAAARGKAKVEARLSLERLGLIRQQAQVPLVLHGGTGIRKSDVLAAVRLGIAKINVATAIRQPYEANLGRGVAAAQDAVHQAMLKILREDLELAGSAAIINPKED